MKKKKLWILFIITTSVYAYLMLVTVPALKAMAGGMDILDVPPFYDATYIQELLRRLGEEGRLFYLYRQIPVDMIYPGLFAITYYQLIRFFLEKLSQRKLLFLSYFPLIGGIFDYFENFTKINLPDCRKVVRIICNRRKYPSVSIHSQPDVIHSIVKYYIVFLVKIKIFPKNIHFLNLL